MFIKLKSIPRTKSFTKSKSAMEMNLLAYNKFNFSNLFIKNNPKIFKNKNFIENQFNFLNSDKNRIKSIKFFSSHSDSTGSTWSEQSTGTMGYEGSSASAGKNDQRYFYEFESPENQYINFKSFKKRLFKMLIIISGISALFFYFFLKKYNKLAKRKQIYFLTEELDVKLSEYASKVIQTLFKYYLFRHDSEDTKMVFRIYKKILEDNKVKISNDITAKNVFVVDSISIGAFLFKNGDLFLSEKILDISNRNENEIALFIATEVASNLMDKTTERILKYFLNEIIIKSENKNDIPKLTFVGYKMKFFERFNKYLYFYPESLVSTVFEESEIIRLSLKLLNNSKFNLVEAIEVFRKFDEKLKNYPKNYQENILVSKESRFYDICRKHLKIYLIKNNL
jgi:hypothetical protein